uniref:Uncharacterized protein n=1 Tax=Desertifilum tharense IPPAS B-1220 TaxID=1781255 RepID=A0ACD5GTJ7_9CYAN
MTVTPTPTPTPSPIVTPTPTPAPVTYEQFLNIQPNRVANLENQIRANETVRYAFNVEEPNDFNAYLSGEGVLMSLFGTRWRGVTRANAKCVDLGRNASG